MKYITVLILVSLAACSDQAYDCDPSSPDCYENPNYGKATATPTPTPTETPYTAADVTKPGPTPTVTVTVTPTPDVTPAPTPTPTTTPEPTPGPTPTPTPSASPTPAQLLYITEGMGTLLANNGCPTCSGTLLSNVAPFYHDASDPNFTTTQTIYDFYTANQGTCTITGRQFSIDVTPGHDTHWNGILSDIRTMTCESGHQAQCSCTYVVQGYTQVPN